MKLYNSPAPNPRRVRIYLAEKGLEVPMEDVAMGDGGTRSAAFLAKNSLGQLPVLELDDGTILTESVAICRYFEALHPDPPLFGADALEQARVEMWSRRIELTVFPPIGQVALHTFEFFADKVEQLPAYAQSQRRAAPQMLAWLDGELSDGRPYLVGERFSVADITGMLLLYVADFVQIDMPASHRHLSGWAERLRARPSWQA